MDQQQYVLYLNYDHTPIITTLDELIECDCSQRRILFGSGDYGVSFEEASQALTEYEGLSIEPRNNYSLFHGYSLPRAVLVDIDGTLLDVDNVKHLVAPDTRDIEQFHVQSASCPPNRSVVEIVEMMQQAGMGIVLVTSREEKWRSLTEQWLEDNDISYDVLYMRDESDERSSVQVKLEQFRYIKNSWSVVHSIDDDDDTISLWSSLGIMTTVVPTYW